MKDWYVGAWHLGGIISGLVMLGSGIAGFAGTDISKIEWVRPFWFYGGVYLIVTTLQRVFGWKNKGLMAKQ